MFYKDLIFKAVEYICKETEMKVVLVENSTKLETLFSIDCPTLKTVVIIDQTDEKLPEKEGVKE